MIELDNAIQQLNALCQPSEQSIAELDVYIQDHIMDPVWNFQCHQIEYPEYPETDSLKGGLHPLFFNESGYKDVSIGSKNMTPNLSLKDYGLFAQVTVAAEKSTALVRLLPSAVNAEPESYKSYQEADERRLAAIAILTRHPELLFEQQMVTDHYNRKIWASAYQLFLGAGDSWALKQVHKIIIEHNWETKAQEQFEQQFPDCKQPFDSNMEEEALYDERNIEQIKQVKAQLKVISEKLTRDPITKAIAPIDEITKALEELYQIFTPKQDEVIRTGLHFPLAILREVYGVFNAQYKKVQENVEPSWGKELAPFIFFSLKIIGATLRASTAVDGQCYKIGLSTLDMEKGPSRWDNLFCEHPEGIPNNLAPIKDKLGRTMFVDPYNGFSCFQSATPGQYDWYSKVPREVHRLMAPFHISKRGGCPKIFEAELWEKLWRAKAETYAAHHAAIQKKAQTPTQRS